MSYLLAGFSDELGKTAGVLGKTLKGVGGFVKRHPWLTLGGGITGVATGVATREGYKSGRSGNKARYLKAGPDEHGRIMPSEAALTNYHSLFRHKLSPKQVKALSKHYREKAFK